jgi:catechol 2,3-dioxygenase-like lactoylglutathione lyase family enzyme
MSVVSVAPILRVANIGRAVSFYCSVLGFRKDFQYSNGPHGPDYAGVSIDGHALHLSTFPGDGPGRTATYFYVDDVDGHYAAFREAGLSDDAVVFEPTDQTWGQREVYVRDPDGNVLRFGSPAGASG